MLIRVQQRKKVVKLHERKIKETIAALYSVAKKIKIFHKIRRMGCIWGGGDGRGWDMMPYVLTVFIMEKYSSRSSSFTSYIIAFWLTILPELLLFTQPGPAEPSFGYHSRTDILAICFEIYLSRIRFPYGIRCLCPTIVDSFE